MRLKSIKLAGFKSFVDPTTVHFPGNLTAVVGPNGCGKSNIIDAVRWVMGESSAKHLRGESMADVIFNGSGGRKPVGQASIELIFDNSDSTLGGEYAGYSEISIRRKVTRDGLSNYYLNSNKCRRRDITDIFLGTGLGPRSYAIIEQGMISNLIEAKPDELRVYIEEAAGISKYKERRRDTENRMRRTQENLERLSDIRDELARQLQRLERQAQAAEKYAEYKNEERTLKAQLQALRWRELDGMGLSKQGLTHQQELEIEALVTERSGCDNSLEKLRTRYTDESDAFNAIQGQYYAVGAEVARIEQTIEHNRQRAVELQRDIEQTERNYRESERHLQQDRNKVQVWERELVEISPQVQELKDREESLASTLEEAEESMSAWQTRWDEFNLGAASSRQQAEVQQSRIQHIEQVLRRLGERMQKLDGEFQELEISPAEEEVALLEEQLAALDLDIEAQNERLKETTAAIESARRDNQAVVDNLSLVRGELQTLKGRKASLEALQQAALDEGSGDGLWVRENGLADAARLLSSLDVDSGWDVAVETVLGAYLQAFCVDRIDPFIDSMETVQEGEIILMEPTELPPRTNAVSGVLLSAYVKGRRLPLFDSVYAVDSVAEAIAQRAHLGPGESVISRDGLWLGADWARVSKGKSATRGVLQRQQELAVIAQQYQALEKQLEDLSDSYKEGEKNLLSYEKKRAFLSETIAKNQRSYGELRSQVGACRTRLEQLGQRREQLREESQEMIEQRGMEQEQLAEARLLLQQALDAMEADSGQREQMLTERDRLRNSLDQARQGARHGRDRLQELTMREHSLSTQLFSARESIQRFEGQVARLGQHLEQLKAALHTQDDPTEELAQQLEGLLEKRLAVEKSLGEVRGQLETVEDTMRQTESRRARLEQDISEKRAGLEQARLVVQEIHTRCQTLVEQITSHGFVLEELLLALGEDAQISLWEESIERLANRIQRLGAINLAAIDEYKTESERKTYLDAQNEELSEALTTLESAIRKIDRETRTRFKETFDKVNHSLQELFPKVFGGGHAYLELTGDDLLDTGVTIMARPPGKKNTTIHLLSGGEKALVAIALVFAIFSLNPAPFCMLDEVDAPLDDANVARYASMVEEMSKQVQFVYITHNKIAMEMAHNLMGVTMQEPGVSRLVSVDVDKAVALAEA